MTRLAVVVPTRNRPVELRRLLCNLAMQSRQPDQVVVVDGSDPKFDCELIATSEWGSLNVGYLRYQPPSAAAQRNAGIAAVADRVDLVALIDDDVVLDLDCVAIALSEINGLPEQIVGFGLNEARLDTSAARAKRWPLTRMLGLYSDRNGAVTRSGWHTRLRYVSEVTDVDWLSTCAAVWRSRVLRRVRFDEFFQQYSYLEDLEFSIQVRALGRLVLLPTARFAHYPASGGRKSRFWFGRIEVRNRYYIVRKHGLSKPRFFLGMLGRMGLTLADIARGRWLEAGRLAGNVYEISRSIIPRNRAARKAS